MNMEKANYSTIDDYIAQYPPEIQIILQKIRQIIHENAPEATEAISYQMPTFKMKKNLIHFAAFQKHIGLYPTPSGIVAFKEELAPYESGKGSIQFPLNQPIPYDLIKKIVIFRVNEEKSKPPKKR